MAAPVRAVLFDAGNTLVWIDTHLMAAAAGGLDATRLRDADRAIRPVINAGLERMIDAGLTGGKAPGFDFHLDYHGGILKGGGVPEAEVPVVLDRLMAADRILSFWRHPNPEARPAIERLKASGVRVAVVSNSDGRVSDLLHACAFGDLFEFIMDSGLEGIEKPDPRIFLRACERLGTTPEETAYVGDFPVVDVRGSRAAGLIPVLYDPLDAWPHWQDSHRIRDLRDLPGILGIA